MEKPDRSNAEWVCGQSNKDTCYVHKSSFDHQKEFHVGIACLEKDCEVNFKVEIARNIILENGEEF